MSADRASQDRVCLGVMVGAHGVRGLVKVKPFTEVPEDVAAYGPVSDKAGKRRWSLEVKGRELWIAGERPFVREAGEAVYQVLERSYGPFARKFPLAPDADLKNISAVFKNGLLTVTVPRRKRPKKLLDVG